jgi:hypothetical protein
LKPGPSTFRGRDQDAAHQPQQNAADVTRARGAAAARLGQWQEITDGLFFSITLLFLDQAYRLTYNSPHSVICILRSRLNDISIISREELKHLSFCLTPVCPVNYGKINVMRRLEHKTKLPEMFFSSCAAYMNVTATKLGKQHILFEVVYDNLAAVIILETDIHK